VLGRVDLDIALPTLHLHSGGSLPGSSDLQLGHQPRLFVLVKSPSYLAHHDARRIAAVGQVIAVCRQNANTAIDQGQDAQFLRDNDAGAERSLISAPMVVFTSSGPLLMKAGMSNRIRLPMAPATRASTGVLIRKMAMNAVSRFCVPVSGSISPHFSEIMGLGRTGAQERTRTFTAVKPLAPEASASTNSATWARAG
jgi:hypothetical protein